MNYCFLLLTHPKFRNGDSLPAPHPPKLSVFFSIPILNSGVLTAVCSSPPWLRSFLTSSFRSRSGCDGFSPSPCRCLARVWSREMKAEVHGSGTKAAEAGTAIARWGQSRTDDEVPSSPQSGTGMLQPCRGTTAPWTMSPLQSWSGNVRKPFWEKQGESQTLLSSLCVLLPGTAASPADPIPLPQQELGFITNFLRSPFATAIPLRGALALPSPCFLASFPVY